MQLSKKWQRLIRLIALAIIIIIIISLYALKGKLIKHHNIASATIVKCEWASRGTARYIVEGTFKVLDKEYSASCQLSCQDLKLSELRNKLLNLKTSVVYSPENPSINYLLIEEQSFRLYNVPISDSLKLVTEFVQCR